LVIDGLVGVTAIDCRDATVSVSGVLPVPPLFVALTVTGKTPAAVGVPEIKPEVLLTVSPVGKPVAP
jgi:hypothetical protein